MLALLPMVNREPPPLPLELLLLPGLPKTDGVEAEAGNVNGCEGAGAGGGTGAKAGGASSLTPFSPFITGAPFIAGSRARFVTGAPASCSSLSFSSSSPSTSICCGSRRGLRRGAGSAGAARLLRLALALRLAGGRERLLPLGSVASMIACGGTTSFSFSFFSCSAFSFASFSFCFSASLVAGRPVARVRLRVAASGGCVFVTRTPTGLALWYGLRTSALRFGTSASASRISAESRVAALVGVPWAGDEPAEEMDEAGEPPHA